MKVSELSGADLDLWVAKAIGKHNMEIEDDGICWEHILPSTDGTGDGIRVLARSFQPSSEWFEGGKLIDRYDILFCRSSSIISGMKAAYLENINVVYDGETKLEAAMRALVFSVFGEEVEE